MKDKIKAHLVLPRDLVQAVKKAVGPRKQSEFIAQATKEKLEKMRFDLAFKEAIGAWKEENHPDLKKESDVRKYIRRIREGAISRSKRLEKYHRG